jgi:hypothetical protein
MTVDECLYDYFSGEIDGIIKRFENKIEAGKKGFSDDYYWTVTSVDLTQPKGGKTNRHSDPTGNAATKIADLRDGRDDEYLKYLNIKNTLDNIFNSWSDEHVLIIKGYINFDDYNIATVVRNISMNRYQIKKKANELINIIEKRLDIEDDSNNSRLKEIAV